jgi:hypothetical protein
LFSLKNTPRIFSAAPKYIGFSYRLYRQRAAPY